MQTGQCSAGFQLADGSGKRLIARQCSHVGGTGCCSLQKCKEVSCVMGANAFHYRQRDKICYYKNCTNGELKIANAKSHGEFGYHVYNQIGKILLYHRIALYRQYIIVYF